MSNDRKFVDGLVLATGRGDRVVFAQLYDTISRLVFGLISGRVHDRGEAEALMVKAFLEIWRTSAHFDPAVVSAVHWILACVQRVALSPDAD